MRERLEALGIPVPDWATAVDADAVAAFLAAHGGVAIAKTPRGGYDGKGVRVVRDAHAVDDWLGAGTVLLEELVPFRRELAQLVARRPSGELAVWPVVETVQRDGVCAEVTAPAPGPDSAVAAEIGERIAVGLGVTGVLAVELFETADGRLLVNELAMRPHNSGHWTIDGAVTSQFEQHLRAVLDLPLGDPSPRAPWSVMVNVLGGPPGATIPDRYPAAMTAHPAVRFHDYGKASRPGRKVGHVTATGSSLDAVLAEARAAARFFDS
jgi:5-(carboxyamino)imidazole ribonucleotide synthase